MLVWSRDGGKGRLDVQRRLDALRRRHGQQRLRHSGAETREHSSRTGELAILVGEERLVLIKGDEAYAC